jgi:hypothetical protein
MYVWRILRVLSILIFIVASGCASIPPEAPELSAELGNRISAIEVSNVTLLHRFFDMKRREVDRLIEQEWVPLFAENIFSDPIISRDWNTIVSENNKQERLKFLVKLGPKLQEEINKKRLELIKPLDVLEREIENRIRTEYSQAKAINNSLTSFLLSASKVAETRKRYLEMVGITDEKIGEVINETDEAVSNLLVKGRDAEKRISAVEEYLGRLKTIKDKLQMKGE